MASHMSIEEMTQNIGVDTLTFLSINGMYRAVTGQNKNEKNPKYCDACFTGNYPIPVGNGRGKKSSC